MLPPPDTKEGMDRYWEHMRDGKYLPSSDEHKHPSPETLTRLAVMDVKFDNLNVTLEEVVKQISSTKNWLIVTLFSVIISTIGYSYSIVTWKTSIDYRLAQVEKELASLSK